MGIGAIFKKQGGFSLVKNYAYNYVLFYALCVFVVVPKTKKGLELFRECVGLKIYARVKRKYKGVVQKFLSEKTDCPAEVDLQKPKIIWFCWLQGLENAPSLVKKCYESIKTQCSDYEIRIITAENFSLWADIPEFIITKWKDGMISHAHFSDILRTALLVKNGGTWIDATVLLTGKIPSDIEAAPLFLFRTFKPGSDGKTTTLSSWFISACPNATVLGLAQNLLYEYWKKHNYLCDYFLFHIFVQTALDALADQTERIPPYTNETPHLMLFELGNLFSEEKWESITSQSFCHKLTNKLTNAVMNREATFYKHIVLGDWDK